MTESMKNAGEQLAEARADLEKAIQGAIQAFERKSGAVVARIDLAHSTDPFKTNGVAIAITV